MSAKSLLCIVATMVLSCVLSLFLLLTTTAVLGEIVTNNSTVSPEESTIDVVLYIESRCPDSSRFIKNHLVPFYKQYPNVIRNLRIIPFGIADCARNPRTGEIKCTCQHHEAECEMNQLMNCITQMRPRSEHLQMISCIQGRPDLEDSIHCLSTLSKPEQKDLISCAKGPLGAQLHYESGKRTKQAGVNWVPWIEVSRLENLHAYNTLSQGRGKELGVICIASRHCMLCKHVVCCCVWRYCFELHDVECLI